MNCCGECNQREFSEEELHKISSQQSQLLHTVCERQEEMNDTLRSGFTANQKHLQNIEGSVNRILDNQKRKEFEVIVEMKGLHNNRSKSHNSLTIGREYEIKVFLVKKDSHGSPEEDLQTQTQSQTQTQTRNSMRERLSRSVNTVGQSLMCAGRGVEAVGGVVMNSIIEDQTEVTLFDDSNTFEEKQNTSDQSMRISEITLSNVWCELSEVKDPNASVQSQGDQVEQIEIVFQSYSNGEAVGVVSISDSVPDDVVFVGDIHMQLQLSGESKSVTHYWKFPLPIKTRKNSFTNKIKRTTASKAKSIANFMKENPHKIGGALLMLLVL